MLKLFVHRDNAIFSSSVKHLLETLAPWQPSQQNGQQRKGLTLEITLSTLCRIPGDFYTREGQILYALQSERELIALSNRLGEHRARASYRRLGSRFTLSDPLSMDDPARIAKKRILRRSLRLAPIGALSPQITLIEGLIVRLSDFQIIDVEVLGLIVRESLVALRWFRYERFPLWTRSIEVLLKEQYIKLLLPSFPSSLEQLYWNQLSTYSEHKTKAGWGKHLFRCEECCGFTELRISYIDGARDFPNTAPYEASAAMIRTIGATFQFQKLKLLCLHTLSQGQYQNQYHSHCSSLQKFIMQKTLCEAAKVARQMPSLQIMELWCSSKGSLLYDFLFRYKALRLGNSIYQGESTITWKTPKYKPQQLEPETMEAWRGAFKTKKLSDPALCPLVFYQDNFEESEEEIVAFNGTFIHKYLELMPLRFDPDRFAKGESSIASLHNR